MATSKIKLKIKIKKPLQRARLPPQPVVSVRKCGQGIYCQRGPVRTGKTRSNTKASSGRRRRSASMA